MSFLCDIFLKQNISGSVSTTWELLTEGNFLSSCSSVNSRKYLHSAEKGTHLNICFTSTHVKTDFYQWLLEGDTSMWNRDFVCALQEHVKAKCTRLFLQNVWGLDSLSVHPSLAGAPLPSNSYSRLGPAIIWVGPKDWPFSVQTSLKRKLLHFALHLEMNVWLSVLLLM